MGTEGWSKGGRSETAGVRAETASTTEQGILNEERGSDATATHHAV